MHANCMLNPGTKNENSVATTRAKCMRACMQFPSITTLETCRTAQKQHACTMWKHGGLQKVVQARPRSIMRRFRRWHTGNSAESTEAKSNLACLLRNNCSTNSTGSMHYLCTHSHGLCMQVSACIVHGKFAVEFSLSEAADAWGLLAFAQTICAQIELNAIRTSYTHALHARRRLHFVPGADIGRKAQVNESTQGQGRLYRQWSDNLISHFSQVLSLALLWHSIHASAISLLHCLIFCTKEPTRSFSNPQLDQIKWTASSGQPHSSVVTCVMQFATSAHCTY